MKRNTIRRFAIAGTVAAALISGSALAEPVGLDTLLGEPAAADVPVDKVIMIEPGTRWVNVTQDDTVKFIVHGNSGAEKSFAWHFASPRFAVDLSQIAPQGMIDRSVIAYLASDPLYDEE
jgi:hypothetical protein